MLVIVGAVLALVSGIGFIGANVLSSQVEGSVGQDNLLGDAGGRGSGDPLSGALNILMIGLDARPGESDAASRADTIIIVHIPADHQHAYLISVPRDLMVDVQPYKKSNYGGGRAKMTESFFHGAQNGAGIAGGTELLALTIKKTLGVSFRAAAIINFESFEQVVEALGGVEMCVDQTVTSKHLVMGPNGPINIENDPKGKEKGKAIIYTKGTCRTFAAWEALDFSRQRYGLTNGDYDRQRHQQQLVKAIVKKATSGGVMTNPGKLNGLIKAAGKAFVVDTGGMSVTDFVFNLKSVAGGGMTTLRTNAGKITSERVDNISYETLTPLSLSMFKAVNEDKVEAFAAAHPEFVSSV